VFFGFLSGFSLLVVSWCPLSVVPFSGFSLSAVSVVPFWCRWSLSVVLLVVPVVVGVRWFLSVDCREATQGQYITWGSGFESKLRAYLFWWSLHCECYQFLSPRTVPESDACAGGHCTWFGAQHGQTRALYRSSFPVSSTSG
jgi:hypothetical protein